MDSGIISISFQIKNTSKTIIKIKTIRPGFHLILKVLNLNIKLVLFLILHFSKNLISILYPVS